MYVLKLNNIERSYKIDGKAKSDIDILEMHIFSTIIDGTLSKILHTLEGIALQFPEIEDDLRDGIQNEGLLFV